MHNKSAFAGRHATIPPPHSTPIRPVFFTLFLIPIVCICGNGLICWAVWFDVNLRKRFNFFLVSLAVSDLLSSVLVMPLSAVKMIKEDIMVNLGYNLCLIWHSLDVFFTASTIIHLCVISLDRYIGLRKPLASRQANGACGGCGGAVTGSSLNSAAKSLKMKSAASALAAGGGSCASGNKKNSQYCLQRRRSGHHESDKTLLHRLNISSSALPASSTGKKASAFMNAPRKRSFILQLALAWIIPFCAAGPLFFFSIYLESGSPTSTNAPTRSSSSSSSSSSPDLRRPRTQSFKDCGPNNEYFIIISTVLTFFVPLLIMLATYVLTCITIHRQQRAIDENLRGTTLASLVFKPKITPKFAAPSASRQQPGKKASGSSFSLRPKPGHSMLSDRALDAEAESSIMTKTMENSKRREVEEGQHKRAEATVSQHVKSNQVTTTGAGAEEEAVAAVISGGSAKDPIRLLDIPFKKRISYKEMDKDEKTDVKEDPDHIANADAISSNSGKKKESFLLRIPSLNTSPLASPFKKTLSSFKIMKRKPAAHDSEHEMNLKRINRSRKAMRTLGILFLLFIICYLPFFVLYLIHYYTTLHYQHQAEPHPLLSGNATVSSTFASSTYLSASTSEAERMAAARSTVGNIFIFQENIILIGRSSSSPSSAPFSSPSSPSSASLSSKSISRLQFFLVFFEWVGYSGSMLNPIIYTVSNRDFQRFFLHLIYQCHFTRPQIVDFV